MQVTVIGLGEVRTKLVALPGNLRQRTQAAAPIAANMEAEAIRSETPRLTGRLAGSIQVSVTRTVDGVLSKVFSDERYAPFVDRGTRQHGVGRHMFERGSEQVQGQVEDVYRAAVDEVADNF